MLGWSLVCLTLTSGARDWVQGRNASGWKNLGPLSIFLVTLLNVLFSRR